MKYGNNFVSIVIRITLLVATISLGSNSVLAKMIYDPFVQEFQVGSHSNPDKIELSWGYPAGLLNPASLDTAWTAAGLEILAQTPSLKSPHLCLSLLAAMNDTQAAESWTRWHRLRIEQLVSWPDSVVTEGRYLLAERLAMGFFRAQKNGDLQEALKFAERLASPSSQLGLPARDVFVWELRQRLISRMLKEKSKKENMFWDSMLDLGSFDLGNAWALWTSHYRLNGYPALPESLHSLSHARKLAGLRESWLTEADIRNSRFSKELKSGLGAKILKGDDLNKHLAAHAAPPGDFQIQGWWVSGQRTSRRGQADYYESLGKRSDLKPGWSLDLYRRASEVHLLNNRWESGLEDLELSLEKASAGAGTSGQRRRLRQWVEQALVLAIAEGDSLSARKIHTLGKEKLTGSQQSVFLTETAHWSRELGQALDNNTDDTDFKTQIQKKVQAGNSIALKPCDDDRKKDFGRATATPLWNLWARWGMALLGDNQNDDITEYRRHLTVIINTKKSEAQREAVIRAVAIQLKNKLDREGLLRWALDKDIHHLSGGLATTAMSPMSDFAKSRLDDSAALHALLGIALLADDLRGIVGVATPMSQTGLTKQEKLCFLYPLPSAGSIHKALSAADNDPALLLAVARNESLFEPSVRSRAGALGWMQIMPFHFPHKGALPGADNWSCAAVSIARGDGLLVENRRRYKGNPYLTLAAYNAGPGAVSRWQKQLSGNTRNDIFLAWIGYPETRHYVEKVLIDREIYNWIISESRLTY